MNTWGLLKKFVRDLEDLNKVQLGNESWQLVKQLDRDIQQYIYENYERPNMPTADDDGLLTCSVCQDRYTTNADSVCDHCRHQAWLDANA